jgi:hypothetical protein
VSLSDEEGWSECSLRTSAAGRATLQGVAHSSKQWTGWTLKTGEGDAEKKRREERQADSWTGCGCGLGGW